MMIEQHQIDTFIEIFGGTEDNIRVFEAPGRINLIGEHVDYNGGHVMPVALDMKTIVIARANDTNMMNFAATDLPDRVHADINHLESYKTLHWGNYQCGVAHVMKNAGYPIVGCDLLYHGTLPFGAGLSSSASIEIATAVALAHLGGRNELNMVEIAQLCQKAENDYVGMNCGIMDQFISANAKKGHALFFNCATLACRHVPLNLGDYTIVITNTNMPHHLVDSQYNQRRSECEQALAAIRANGGNYENLCSIPLHNLMEYERFFENKTLYRRARHCVTEEARTLASLEALRSGDIQAFGKLLIEANISVRDDYEVTGAALDTLFDIAVAQDGVIGSRMTGAGFGGCNISIVEKSKVSKFQQIVEQEYRKRIGYAPSFYQSTAGNGACEVENWR